MFGSPVQILEDPGVRVWISRCEEGQKFKQYHDEDSDCFGISRLQAQPTTLRRLVIEGVNTVMRTQPGISLSKWNLKLGKWISCDASESWHLQRGTVVNLVQYFCVGIFYYKFMVFLMSGWLDRLYYFYDIC